MPARTAPEPSTPKARATSRLANFRRGPRDARMLEGRYLLVQGDSQNREGLLSVGTQAEWSAGAKTNVSVRAWAWPRPDPGGNPRLCILNQPGVTRVSVSVTVPAMVAFLTKGDVKDGPLLHLSLESATSSIRG